MCMRAVVSEMMFAFDLLLADNNFDRENFIWARFYLLHRFLCEYHAY